MLTASVEVIPAFMHAANEVSGDNLAFLLACIQKDIVLVHVLLRVLRHAAVRH